MGRQRTTNKNLPNGVQARRRARKNGSTTTYYYYTARQNGKRKEISLGTDYHQALLRYAQMEINVAQDIITFNIAAARYQTDIIAELAHNPQKSYARSIKHLETFFNGAPLEQITPQHIRQYLDRRRPYKAAANLEIGFFHAIFNHAREIGYTNAANPSAGVKRYPIQKRNTYIEDDLYLLVYQAANQQMKDLMDIAYLIGQRPIDVVSIHTRDIQNGELIIQQQKTQHRLRFALSGSLKEIIERITPKDGGYLFRNSRGTPLKRQTLTNQFAALRNRLIQAHPELENELHNFQFRDLRAKSGTDKFLSGDRAAAQEQLGHTSSKTTSIYIRKGRLIDPLKKIKLRKK